MQEERYREEGRSASAHASGEENFPDGAAGVPAHPPESAAPETTPVAADRSRADGDSRPDLIGTAQRESRGRRTRTVSAEVSARLAAAIPPGAQPGGALGDEALFLRYQQGDDAAFVLLYERYKANIYAYCAQVLLSTGLPRELVEDTFQEVFMRLAQYRHTFTGGEFKAWLFTVARHSCLSAKRKGMQYLTATEQVGDGENFDDTVSHEIRRAFSRSDDPLERLTKEEQTRLLLAAIGRLPEAFREALILSEYEGLSYEEIARITETSLSTIRIRIFRAKARLRKMLLPVIGDGVDRLLDDGKA